MKLQLHNFLTFFSVTSAETAGENRFDRRSRTMKAEADAG